MKKKIIFILAIIVVFTAIMAGIWCEKEVARMNQIQQKRADIPKTKKAEKKQKTSKGKGNMTLDQGENMLQTMTLEETVAQLYIVTPEELTGYSTVTEAGEMTKNLIKNYPVGGFIYMAQNIQSPDQVKRMIENVQAYSMERIGLPLFISVDEEGGTVTRFGNNPNFNLNKIGSMKAIGETGDTQNAYQVGVQIGSFLHDLGFNMDNAPDADVLTNPANKVIGARSFGTDPDLVADMAVVEMQGLEQQNIIPVIKHFPGHGATEADTHEGYAYTDKTLEEMKRSELVPFQKSIESKAYVIMVAHISCPNITGDSTPASLSHTMITDILREEMGYRGVVITDALNMGAIAEEYTSAQAAVKALQAGTDILLMPENFEESYKGIIHAVNNGEITEERINESVRRILKLKLKLS